MLDRLESMVYFHLCRSALTKIRYLWYFLLPLLLTAGLRESGVTRQWDLFALDRLLSLRPPEAMDDRITIVTIDEEDLKKDKELERRAQAKLIAELDGSSGKFTKGFGIRAVKLQQLVATAKQQNLARAIELIVAAKPSVIGVDIIHGTKIAPELENAYRNHQNVIGLAKLLPPDPLPAPPGVTSQRAGFGDYEPDVDGLVRRAMLASFNQSEQTKYSFAFQIARLYLQQRDRKIQISPERLELASHSIPPFQIGDHQNQHQYFDILVNYRNSYANFTQIKLADILAGKSVNLQNKIVLIGYTAITKHDFINTTVVRNPEINGRIYGIEYHGHIVSQIISTSLDERNFIQSLPFWADYLWALACIISSGLVLKIVKFKTPFWQLLLVISGYLAGVCLSIYLLLLAGWWLPFGLTLPILVINVPMLVSLYQREQSLLAISEKRRQAISETFNAIHNGPLQDLSLLLRSIKSDNISLTEISQQLEDLNHKIRQIGESLQQDPTIEGVDREMLVLGNGDRLNLNIPLNDLFYSVSERTLNHDRYICLKIKVVDFQEIPTESKLSIDDKHQLCQFLEEAIGNVGKYAEGATRLQLLGRIEGNIYRLSIEDNGLGRISDRVGEGTKKAQLLAARLKGNFTRTQKSTQGVICAIEWSL